MSIKHQLQKMEAAIDQETLRRASDEYADLLLTMCLCMKIAGPTRANVRACSVALKQRLVTCHSQNALNQILNSWDPVGCFLGMRREANEAAATFGEPADSFCGM